MWELRIKPRSSSRATSAPDDMALQPKESSSYPRKKKTVDWRREPALKRPEGKGCSKKATQKGTMV